MGFTADRARRYFRASPDERARKRRHALLRLVGQQPPRKETPHEAWQRLIVEGRQYELVTRAEPFVIRVGDSVIGQSLFLTGEFEFGKLGAALQHLGVERVGTLVDVGANIGTVCIPAIRRGLAERAVAIEPDPDNFSLLTTNVALNGLLDVVVRHRVAAAPTTGLDLHLALAEENLGDHRIAAPDAPETARRPTVAVPGVALDELVPDLSPATDLIWIDVQGFEGQVLRGATALLARRVPVVVELWPRGLAAHGGIATLEEAFAPYAWFVDLGAPEPARRPVAELGGLYRQLSGGDPEAHTDILVV